MDSLNTVFLTFNCARELVDPTYLASSLTNTLVNTNLPPDLIVLSLQEIAPISSSFLGGSFLAPYFSRFTATVSKVTQTWAGTEYENVLSTNLGMTALMLFARPDVAINISSTSTGGTGVGVWEMGNKGAVGARLGFTIPGTQDRAHVTFVAAHLAPMEDACEQRNRDWASIASNLVFSAVPKSVKVRTAPVLQEGEAEPLLASATDNDTDAAIDATHPSRTPISLFNPPTPFLFGGDLNYRTSDVKPHPDDHSAWPQPLSSSSSSDHSAFAPLFANDQLTREHVAGRTLHGLTETPPTFPPTYKYSPEAQAHAKRLAQNPDLADAVPGPSVSAWASHRIPSWCDRVLWHVPGARDDGAENAVTVYKYTSLPLQPSSDHQPVVLHVALPLRDGWKGAAAAPVPSPMSRDLDDTATTATSTSRSIDGPTPRGLAPEETPTLKDQPTFLIAPDWRERRRAARRWEVAVGWAAYFSVTTEGRVLLFGLFVGILGGWAALRSLLIY